MSEQARRALILEAASRLFTEHGPQKTTIADIAKEANIGVGTVYLEFSSKESIIEALSQDRYQAVLKAMQRAASEEGQTYCERIAGCLEARLRTFLDHSLTGAHACDLFHCQNPAVKTTAQAFQAEETRLLTRLLEQGVGAGELALEDPALAAKVVLLAQKPLTPPWLLMLPEGEVAVLARELVRLLLEGMRARQI